MNLSFDRHTLGRCVLPLTKKKKHDWEVLSYVQLNYTKY